MTKCKLKNFRLSSYCCFMIVFYSFLYILKYFLSSVDRPVVNSIWYLFTGLIFKLFGCTKLFWGRNYLIKSSPWKGHEFLFYTFFQRNFPVKTPEEVKG